MTEENKTAENGGKIKGSLYRWSQDSAEWYERASEYTGYHDRLTELIAPQMEKEKTCCELACGTGTLARHLAPYVSSYTANDIDPNATAHLSQMIADGSHDNLQVIQGDWRIVFAGRQFDYAVFSFFGAIVEDWEQLKKTVKEKIFVITPRKMEGKMKVISDKSTNPASPDNPQKIIHGKARNFETGVSISEFLDKKGISYTKTDLNLEFGQPFQNLSEARDYVRYYYNLEENQIDFFLEQKLEKTETGWYFPKQKEICIVTVDMLNA